MKTAWVASTVLVVLISYADGYADFDKFAICTASGAQQFPAVSGSLVVWGDGPPNWGIYGKNIATGSNYVFSTGDGASGPDVSGNIVVWLEPRDGNDAICGYDVAAGHGFVISVASHDYLTVRIDGDLVVWGETLRDGNSVIWGCDLSTMGVFRISEGRNRKNPVSAGQTVVWSDTRNSSWAHDIYGKDLATGLEFLVYQSSTTDEDPDICGNTVVWGHGGNNIMGYDLDSNHAYVICDAPGIQKHPRISSSTVVWRDGRDSSATHGEDIYGYSIDTGTAFPVSTDDAICHWMDIDGNLVVWSERPNTSGPELFDIYGAYIPEPATLSLLALGLPLLTRRRRNNP